MNEQLIIKVKELTEEDDKKLWYFNLQGEEFPVTFETPRGYIVEYDDGQGSIMWLIRKEHCEELN